MEKNFNTGQQKQQSSHCQAPSTVNKAHYSAVYSSRYHAKWEQEFLEAHNTYRKLHGVPPLALNKWLSSYAQEWANKLASLRKFVNRPNTPYGENLFVHHGPAIAVSGEDPVTYWYQEIQHYNFNSDHYIQRAGHFTQMIWRDTVDLGVGIAEAPNFTIVVANYYPPGNYQCYFKANVPPPSKELYAVSHTENFQTPVTLPGKAHLPGPMLYKHDSIRTASKISSVATTDVEQEVKVQDLGNVSIHDTTELDQMAKEKPKQKTKEEAKLKIKDETKKKMKNETKMKNEAKPKLKSEMKPKMKNETKQKIKGVTKQLMKDEPQQKMKNEPKQKMKDEPKKMMKDEPKRKMKDEAKEPTSASTIKNDAEAKGASLDDVSPPLKPASPVEKPTKPPRKSVKSVKTTVTSPNTAEDASVENGKAEAEAIVPPPLKYRKNMQENTDIELEENFGRDFLKEHNILRAFHGAPPLKINTVLCRYAQTWAKHLSQCDALQHRQNNDFGENIYKISLKRGILPIACVRKWYEQQEHYNFEDGTTRGPVQHFTQLVWKSTQEVGYGAAKSQNYIYLVANYSPTGNVKGQYKNNIVQSIYETYVIKQFLLTSDKQATDVGGISSANFAIEKSAAKQMANATNLQQVIKKQCLENAIFEWQCLEAHNKLREGHGVPPLRLSERLSLYAQKRIEFIEPTSSKQFLTNLEFGENLFTSQSQVQNGADAVKVWYDELASYNFERPVEGTAQRFTQVIWRNTLEMGLATKRTHNRTIVLVTYYPRGNIPFEYVNNVLPPSKPRNESSFFSQISAIFGFFHVKQKRPSDFL